MPSRALLIWLFLSSVPLFGQRPNVVILYADDMGYGDLGIQNKDSKIPTPFLDRLASEGLRFTDGHSSSGICTPSRYALLTGRYHWRKFHGIVNSFGPPAIDPARLTLPEMMQRKGYRTACIGKWHLGWDWDAIKTPGAKELKENGRNAGYPSSAFDWSKPIPGGPLAHGFHYYFGDDVPNFPPYAWFENDRVQGIPSARYAPHPKPSEGAAEGRPGPMIPGWRQDQVMPTLTDKVCEWIAWQKGIEQPFFLYFPWTSPHAPIVPAKEWQGSTKVGGYGDFLHQSDSHAGRVLAALDQHGFRENTIVIFTADNGPEHYAYPRIRNYDHRSQGPLRGLKRDVWEGGHRVPFVVRWPGVVKPGTVSTALVSQIDIMATLASIVGYDLPPTAAEDSYDLAPLWRGEVASVRTTHVHNTFKDVYAVRSGDWVLIDAPSGTHTKNIPKGMAEENGWATTSDPAILCNLSDDLGQRKNRFAENPGKVTELRAVLAKIRGEGHSAPRLGAKDAPR